MVSGKGWPALAGSVPCPYYLKEEDEDEEDDEAGRMADRRGAAMLLVDRWRGGGEVWR